METTKIRFLGIAIGLLLIGGFVTLSNRSGEDADSVLTPGGRFTPSASPFAGRPGIRCPPGPKKAIPRWFPKDLSLPGGTYALDLTLPKVRNYNSVALAVPGSLRDFIRHIVERWVEQGWTFTRSEVEFIDAEAQITKGGSVAAAMVAREVCDKKFVQAYLTYGSI